MMKASRIMSAGASIFLMIFVTACATNREPAVETKVEFVYPPAYLTKREPVPDEAQDPATVSEAVEEALPSAIQALHRCNLKLSELERWREESQEEE